MIRAAAVLLDVMVAMLAVIIAWVVATGGGEFSAAGRLVRLHSVARPAIALCLFYALRVYLRPSGSIAALATLTSLRRSLERLSPVQARLFVLAIVVASASIKVFNAWYHPGFFSGDDVEIQEMTFAQLFQWNWRAWELRSAFFPMIFIYPPQHLLVRIGVTDTRVLIFAGRLVVVAVSTGVIVLLAAIARRQYGLGVALIASLFFGLSRLHVTFGSTELPRPVSTLFVVAAYGLLVVGPPERTSPGWGPIGAGACLGIAAALRFSEIIFIAPAVAMLAVDRRFVRALAVGITAIAVALAIQFASDTLYWHSAFFSLRHIVDYTLVRGLSTRGTQTALYYFTNFSEWTNAFVLVMALVGAAFGAWRALLWAAMPMLMLSALPHKEARYLIPVLPFVALLAAVGFTGMMARVTDVGWHPRYRPAAALAMCIALLLSIEFEVAGVNFAKSDDGVRLAQALNGRTDIRGLAAEQIWRLGSHLYLPNVASLADIEYESLSHPDQLELSIARPDITWIALLRADCPRAPCEETLSRGGYARVDLPELNPVDQYEVFRRHALKTDVSASRENPAIAK